MRPKIDESVDVNDREANEMKQAKFMSAIYSALMGVLIICGAQFVGVAQAEEISNAAAKRLAQFERTGEFDSCLPLRSIREIKPLDDTHFLIRVGVRNYYLNVMSGRCSNAARSSYRLQYTTSLSQLCRHEIVKVVDNTSGFTAGSCAFGDFERLEKIPESKDANHGRVEE